MSEKKKYTYKGSVLHFNLVVEWNWTAETFAVSEKQAASNLIFQYKKKNNLAAATVVRLADKPRLAAN